MSAVLYTIFFINWKKKEKWLAEEENDLQSHDISGWVFIRPAAIYPQVKEFDTHTHTRTDKRRRKPKDMPLVRQYPQRLPLYFPLFSRPLDVWLVVVVVVVIS